MGLVGAAAVAAALAPLWTYAVTLALFGLPHVITELRYVDARFGSRVSSRLSARLAGLLAVIVLLRCAGWIGAGSVELRAALELALGAALVIAVAHMLRGASGVAMVCTSALLAAGIGAAAVAPLEALVWFGFIHNLTPIGFFAERLRGRARRDALAVCVVVFGLLPLWIATGGCAACLTALGGRVTEGGPMSLGALSANLGALVPPNLVATDIARGLFCAAAFLQCMHYAAVLWVLPKLGAEDAAPSSVHATGARTLPLALIASAWIAALLLPIAFAIAYRETRLVYGAFAALHAWIEVPVLLIAFAAAPPPTRMVGPA